MNSILTPTINFCIYQVDKLLKSTSLCFLTILLFCTFGALNVHGQVTGTVFNDYSANGIIDGSEPGFPGIIVTGYGTDGTIYGPVTSSANGTYSLAGVNHAIRIEFTWPSPGPESSTSGGTSVQFVSGSASDIILGIFDPYNNGHKLRDGEIL